MHVGRGWGGRWTERDCQFTSLYQEQKHPFSLCKIFSSQSSGFEERLSCNLNFGFSLLLAGVFIILWSSGVSPLGRWMSSAKRWGCVCQCERRRIPALFLLLLLFFPLCHPSLEAAVADRTLDTKKAWIKGEQPRETSDCSSFLLPR